jgi:lipoprotein-releasing system permease protein
VGDRVTVVMSEAAVTPLGVFPRQKRFVVAGIVDSGTEVDGQALYVHIDDAQRLYRLGTAVHAIRVRLDDLFMAPVAAMEARAMLAPDPVQARDWTDTHGTLYQAIVLQRTTMLMLLSLVIAVAAYNVVSSLVMVVTDKQREIAILRSLGFGRAGVLRSFLVLGSIVGIVGVGLGSALGLAAAYGVADAVAALQQAFGLQLLAQYFIHYLPSAPRLGDVAIVAAIALVLTLLASLYPAWRAARLSPTEILRHE